MKKSVIEKRLNEAMQRRNSAESDEYYYTGKINYHDAEASELRKRRQALRNKKDRASAAIARLNEQLRNAS